MGAKSRCTSGRTLLVFLSVILAASGFVQMMEQPTRNPKLFSSAQAASEGDDPSVQWELFNQHHAKGSWKGVWTTYDFIGDVIDETVASVDMIAKGEDLIDHTHTIVVGAKRSDCKTCFDSMETKTLPVAQYTPDDLKKSRFAACSMVNGPTLLRSGAMASELILNQGDGRVRVIFQHAPVWEQGVEPGSCPPQGLKLFRTTISREALREAPPTAETEAANPPSEGNPIYFRPVPPFNWYKKWSGTSWTWGPQSGNRGWAIEELDDTDAWQGTTPVDSWNLRIGSIHIQCPRVITDASTGICRLAWLPDDETLLRVEAGIMALQPMLVDDDTMVGFQPPTLASLRCDMMKKIGELDRDNEFLPSRDLNKEETISESVEAPAQLETEEKSTKSSEVVAKEPSRPEDEAAGSRPIRDSLSL